MPALFARRGSYGVALNRLLFLVTALGCEWLVHQVQYLIEYGKQFDAVMANSPHHFYMAQAGLVLLVTIAEIVTFLALSLSETQLRRTSLERRLPVRLRRCLSMRPLPIGWSSVTRTTVALAACQMGLYLLQENLESVSATGAWPGFWVLFASDHISVVPLHLLAALTSSILLWTVFGFLYRSRQAVQIARVLLTIIDRRSGTPTRLTPCSPRLPNRRPRAGDLGLRSPPVVCI